MSAHLRRALALYRASPALDAVLLAVLTLPAWRPLLAPGYPDTHDGLFHLFRLVELDRAIRAGVLYPRLAPNLALGYDYPVFNYYAPLSIYLAELPKLTGLGYIDAVKATLALSIVAAGLAMLLFARQILPRPGAFVAALAYAYLPYLLVDVYVRGALAEAAALSLLPFSLWAFRHLARRVDVPAIAVAGLSLGALVLAHNVTALLYLPLLGAYWLLPATGQQKDRPAAAARRLVAGAALALVLGLALTAFYWLPALVERDLIASGRLTDQFFNYHEHFQPLGRLIQTSGAYDYSYDWSRRILFRAGLVQVALAALGLVAALVGGGRRREPLFWGAILAASLALQTSRSAPLWEAVPLSAYVQFPWRLLAPVGLASSLLTGYLAALLPQRLRLEWLGRGAVVAVSIAVVASALAGLPERRLGLTEANVRPSTMQRMELDRKLVAATLGEYLPRDAGASLFDLTKLPERPPTTGDTRVTVREAGLFGLVLDVAAAEPATVLLDRFYFPGWQARIDGEPAPVRSAGPLGLVAADVPAGSHRLTVQFGSTPDRWAGAAASAVGLVLLAALAVVSWRRGRRGGMLAADLDEAGGPALGAGNTRATVARACRDEAPVERHQTSGRAWPRGVAAALAVSAALAIGVASTAGAWPIVGSGPLLPGATADFGPSIRLAGVGVDGTHDGLLDLTLYWQARSRPARDYVVALRLVDPSGRVAGRRDKRPLFGLRPTALWESGEVVRDHQEVALGPAMAAGEYDLVVALFDAEAGSYLRPGEAAREWRDGPDAGVGVLAGRVRVSARPDPRPSGLARESDARFGERIALGGYELSRIVPDGRELPLGDVGGYAATVGQGERLRVRLSWRAVGDLDEDYAVFAHLLDSRQQMVAQDDEWPQRGFRPTTLWLPDEVVPDEYEVRVPEALPPGRYDLSLGVYRRSDQRRIPVAGGSTGDRLSLGTVKVVSRPPLTADRLPVRRRIDVELGGEAALLGYDLHAAPGAIPGGAEPSGRSADLRLRPGGRLVVTLYWRAARRLAQDYTVFVHLYGPPGPPVAQSDGQPSSGSYPTTLWEPGEIVADRHELELPPMPPGHYRLEAGLYLLQTGDRLKLPSGEDRVSLEEVTVAP